MKKVSTNNYQELIIDYLDGKLNPDLSAELMRFLQADPDLLDEYIMVSTFEPIEKTTNCFVNKSSLKKTRLDLISEDDLNNLIISRIEKIETPAEKNRLNSLLLTDPSIKTEINAFTETIVSPDLRITFQDKDSLKRTRSLVPSFYNYAAAAAILLLFTIPFFNQSDKNYSSVSSIAYLKPDANTKDIFKEKQYGQQNAKAALRLNKPLNNAYTQSEKPITKKHFSTLTPVDPVIVNEPVSETIALISNHIINDYSIMNEPIQQDNQLAKYVSIGNKVFDRLFKKSSPLNYQYVESNRQKTFTLAAGGFEFSHSKSKRN